jgi:enoyl-CoA hydratase/carnithine racemase
MPVTVDNHDDTAVVTFRWVEKRNALNPDDAHEIVAALEAASLDSAVVIVTGEGAFCSGGDLPAFAALSSAAPDIAAVRDTVYGPMQSIVRALGSTPVPTIAAIDGPAVGLGFDIALACDMRFVGSDGWIRQGWAPAGLVPGVGGVGLLQRLNPTALWRLVADQERLDGRACAELQLAEAADNALDAALSRARKLAAFGRPLLEHYTNLSRSVAWPDASHFDLSADIQAGLIGSEPFRLLAASILGK